MALPEGVKTSKQKGKKHRKYGRNRAKCARYRLLGRREKNKARRVAKNQSRGRTQRGLSAFVRPVEFLGR